MTYALALVGLFALGFALYHFGTIALAWWLDRDVP